MEWNDGYSCGNEDSVGNKSLEDFYILSSEPNFTVICTLRWFEINSNQLKTKEKIRYRNE